MDGLPALALLLVVLSPLLLWMTINTFRGLRMLRAARTCWAEVAERRELNLTLKGSLLQLGRRMPHLHGTLNGIPLTATPKRVLVRSRGQSYPANTLVMAEPENPPLISFKLSRTSRHPDPISPEKLAGTLSGLLSQPSPLVLALVADPAVRTALERFVSQADAGEVRSSAVHYSLPDLVTKPHVLAEAVDTASLLARALDDFFWGCWQRLADRHDLALERSGPRTGGSGLALIDGAPIGDWARLTGQIDGRGFRVEARSATGNKKPRTTIRFDLDPDLPDGFEVRARRGRKGIETHNPILDLQLEVRGRAPDAIRALLSDDELPGHLMELVNENPGSEIRGHAIWLYRDEAQVLDLEERVEAVIALARQLDHAWAASQSS